MDSGPFRYFARLGVPRAEQLWLACDDLAERLGLPERTVGGLWEAARGLRLRRLGYMKAVEQTAGESITQQTATRDLQMLVRAGLLEARGATRGRHYVASRDVRQIWQQIRQKRSATVDDATFE